MFHLIFGEKSLHHFLARSLKCYAQRFVFNVWSQTFRVDFNSRLEQERLLKSQNNKTINNLHEYYTQEQFRLTLYEWY